MYSSLDLLSTYFPYLFRLTHTIHNTYFYVVSKTGVGTTIMIIAYIFKG